MLVYATQDIINFPMTSVTNTELKKKFKQMNFEDIETKDPDVLPYILQKNTENKDMLLEMRDIRNIKVSDASDKMQYVRRCRNET